MNNEIEIARQYKIIGYEDETTVMVTAVGMQTLLYVTVPMVYFNGILEERSVRIDKFKKMIIRSA